MSEQSLTTGYKKLRTDTTGIFKRGLYLILYLLTFFAAFVSWKPMNFVAVLCSGICPTCLIRVREQLQGNFLMSFL